LGYRDDPELDLRELAELRYHLGKQGYRCCGGRAGKTRKAALGRGDRRGLGSCVQAESSAGCREADSQTLTIFDKAANLDP
jgi:hypothetical protein